MSSLRYLASQLNVSSTTVSAALRGHPWVRASTRMRVLKCAKRHGYIHATPDSTWGKMMAVLRICTGNRRRLVGMDRHKAITQGIYESAGYLRYRVKKFVVHAKNGDLQPILDDLKARNCSGIIILAGHDSDMLRQVSNSDLPCIYADIPHEHIGINSVSPDYYQGLQIALSRLNCLGFQKPGLILDEDLSLVARERLIAAYRSDLSLPCGSTPPIFFTSKQSCYNFEIWLRRHSFDCLLTTDLENTSRLSPEFGPPLFGIYPEAKTSQGGLNLNLAEVGRLAVDTLHHQFVRQERTGPHTHLLVPSTWTTRWKAAEVARWACAS